MHRIAALCAALFVAACELPPGGIFAGDDALEHPEAVAYCAELGAVLFDPSSRPDGLQLAYDACVSVEPGTSEGCWTGAELTAVHGDHYVFAMIRGGALIPVLLGYDDPPRTAVPICEVSP